MGASEYECIHALIDQRINIAMQKCHRGRGIHVTGFDAVHQPRTGAVKNMKIFGRPIAKVMIFLTGKRFGGSQNADVTATGFSGGQHDGRLYADDRQFQLFAKTLYRDGGGGVAGNDDSLDLSAKEKVDDDIHTTVNIVVRSVSPGSSSAISGITEVFSGQSCTDSPGDGQSAKSGIENANWSLSVHDVCPMEFIFSL